MHVSSTEPAKFALPVESTPSTSMSHSLVKPAYLHDDSNTSSFVDPVVDIPANPDEGSIADLVHFDAQESMFAHSSTDNNDCAIWFTFAFWSSCFFASVGTCACSTYLALVQHRYHGDSQQSCSRCSSPNMKEIDASSSKDEAATGSMMGLELPACMHLHLHCPSPNVNAKAEILRWQTPARMEIREYKLHEVELVSLI
ncbi:hypothetical protein V6N13_106689 [Hibiscus sabdariffa]